MGSANIKRIYHGNDIVPMLSVFPFMHAPGLGQPYYLPSPIVGSISVKAHFMVHYVESTAGKSWNNLYQPHPLSFYKESIRQWLDSGYEENTNNPKVIEKINAAFTLHI